jgi:hypothetical protein
MSGPRTPRASMPWQSAQRARKSPIPLLIAVASPSNGFLAAPACAFIHAPETMQHPATTQSTRHVIDAFLNCELPTNYQLPTAN